MYTYIYIYIYRYICLFIYPRPRACVLRTPTATSYARLNRKLTRALGFTFSELHPFFSLFILSFLSNPLTPPELAAPRVHVRVGSNTGSDSSSTTASAGVNSGGAGVNSGGSGVNSGGSGVNSGGAGVNSEDVHTGGSGAGVNRGDVHSGGSGVGRGGAREIWIPAGLTFGGAEKALRFQTARVLQV